jgi:hypothetical protein
MTCQCHARTSASSSRGRGGCGAGRKDAVPRVSTPSVLRHILRGRAQAKLRVGRTDDPQEIEADRMARAVTGPSPVAAPGGTGLDGRGDRDGGKDGNVRAGSAAPGGRDLEASHRAFFEPRFGRSFDGVRVHTGAEAAEAAELLDARAFTVGRDIFFGRGEYRPGNGEGRRLLAHELTHVAQQGGGDGGGGERTIRRTPSASTSCPANANGAPADPVGSLGFIELMAGIQATMTELLLGSDANFMRMGIAGRMEHRRAYERRFGRPEPSGARFRNRFTGGTFDTEDGAIIAEMESLASRYGRIADFLSNDVRYICSGVPGARDVGDCRDDCSDPGRFAWVCAGGPRTIVLCPRFWALTRDEQALALVHEAAHILFGIRNHGSGSVRERGRNAECYASLIGEAGFTASADNRCPPI